MRTKLLFLVIVFSSQVASAQVPSIEQHNLAWDHPGHEQLVFFRIHIAPKEGTYDMTLPHAVVPAYPTMITTKNSSELVLGAPGMYKAIAVAVYLVTPPEYGVSAPSNEIVFQYGALPEDIPPATPPAPPPMPTLPPLPPPLTAPPPMVWNPSAPSSGGGNGWISEDCRYKGTC